MNLHRVLLIEDHAEFRKVLRNLLDPEFNVAELPDGDHAIETVQSFKPDVVLLDVALPGKGGFDLMNELLSSFPNLPVIFVTTHTDRVYVDEAFRRGAVGFVSKGAVSTSLLPELLRVLGPKPS